MLSKPKTFFFPKSGSWCRGSCRTGSKQGLALRAELRFRQKQSAERQRAPRYVHGRGFRTGLAPGGQFRPPQPGGALAPLSCRSLPEGVCRPCPPALLKGRAQSCTCKLPRSSPRLNMSKDSRGCGRHVRKFTCSGNCSDAESTLTRMLWRGFWKSLLGKVAPTLQATFFLPFV